MDLIGTSPNDENPLMYLKRRVASFINLLFDATRSNVPIHPLPSGQKEPDISVYQSALKHLNVGPPKAEPSHRALLPPSGACQVFLDSIYWVPPIPRPEAGQKVRPSVSASATCTGIPTSVQSQVPIRSQAAQEDLREAMQNQRSVSQCSSSNCHHDGDHHVYTHEQGKPGTLPIQNSASDHKHVGTKQDSPLSTRQRPCASGMYKNASICHLCTSERRSRPDEEDSDPPAGPVPLMPFATPCTSSCSRKQEKALASLENSLRLQHCCPTPCNCSMPYTPKPVTGYHMPQSPTVTPSYCQCCSPTNTALPPIPVPIMAPFPYNCYCCFPSPMAAPLCPRCAAEGDTNKRTHSRKEHQRRDWSVPSTPTPSDKEPRHPVPSKEKRKKKKKHHAPPPKSPVQPSATETLNDVLLGSQLPAGKMDALQQQTLTNNHQSFSHAEETEAPITFLKEDKGMCSPTACNKLRSVHCTPGTQLWEHYMPILEFLQCKEYKDMTSDIKVLVQGQEFCAHKMILMTYSTYFRDYLCQRHLDCLDISCLGITPSGFQSALDWMYTTHLTLCEENIGPVWTVANGLGIKKLAKICKRYLRKLVQCKGKDALSKLVGEHQMLKTCTMIVNATNGESLPARVSCKRSVGVMLRLGEYKNWTLDQLCCVLEDDDINIKSEKEVFDLAVAWLNCLCPVRQAHVVRVMSCVRFPLMTRCELMQCFSQPANKFLWKHKECLSMLLVAYMATSSNKKCCLLKESTSETIVQQRTALPCVC